MEVRYHGAARGYPKKYQKKTGLRLFPKEKGNRDVCAKR